MARQARIRIPAGSYHVVARGVNGTRLFRNRWDKERYLERLRQVAAEEQVAIHAYSLQRNHVHFLMTPAALDGLSKLFHRLHGWWSGWFNRTTGRTGHLFQGRYYAAAVDERHFWTALRYIERNPLGAGWPGKLEDWRFGSATGRLRGEADAYLPLTLPAAEHRGWGPQQWREFLGETDREAERRLERATQAGRPCGAPQWIDHWERHTGRTFRWRREPAVHRAA